MADERWDKEGLFNLIREKLGDTPFLAVSNREPYVHSMSGGGITWNRPVGGLVEGIDPVMRAAGGTWIAQGTGDADKKAVDENDRIQVPPDAPEYTLRRVWLTQEEADAFYLGFSNGGLWPLCHVAFIPPRWVDTEWETYKKVNGIFADAVIQEAGGGKATVLVQDYHLALLSRLIKERNPELTVGQFWHIPWPNHEIFRTCPWYREVLEGTLGNSLMGFHVQSFCDNFMDAAEKLPGAEVDREEGSVSYRGNTTLVRPFPISVDFDGIAKAAAEPAVDREMGSLRRELDLEGKYVGIGMDRIDYTKGIPERLMALDRLLADNPQYIGKVVFIQAGMPSRTGIDAYRELTDRTEKLAEDINKKYGTGSWQPVIMLTRQLNPVSMNALRRLGDFCIVSSLSDGMNLVAKEYAAARFDEDGVLILSRFTGAADQMTDALLINPYDTAGFSGAIREALEMPEAERKQRMKKLRRSVDGYNIYRWGAEQVSSLISIAR